MPADFTKFDTSKIKQIRQFKINYETVKNFETVVTRGPLLQTYVDFVHLNPLILMKTTEQPRPEFSDDLKHLRTESTFAFPKGKVIVLSNEELYPAIKASVDQYVRDLAYEGYFAVVYTVLRGTPAQLRNFLKGKRPFVGAVMIGSLPAAWYEDTDGAEFPCDLFFMDLDGDWKDTDADGKYNEHTTNVLPEVWVGRLWTPTAGGNDAELINDYFSRNHRFRKGSFGCSCEGLAYVDDDWSGFGDCALDMAIPAAGIEVVTDHTQTDGDRFKVELDQHRGWLQVCTHSNPGLHSFKVPGAPTEYVYNTYLRDTNAPNAYFYNLFACSSALFTQAEYMAGWYIFDKAGGQVSNGMAAVGSAKSGSMLYFENFYAPMGTGKVVGDAYVDWWKCLGLTHDANEIHWHYGMVLLGDPTMNWFTGAVPIPRTPRNGSVFDHFPRTMRLSWNPVPIAGAKYRVEIDAFGAKNAGKWAAETGQTWLVSGLLNTTSYDHVFVGAQRGRWRVRSIVNNISAPWSDWSYFRFTV